MNQNSDAQNNDLLSRLRENVENRNNTENTVSAESSVATATPEQLLDQLKKQLGDKTVASDVDSASEDDYDISGFEINEAEEPLPETIESTSGSDSQPETNPDDLPWYEDDNEESINEEVPYVVASEETIDTSETAETSEFLSSDEVPAPEEREAACAEASVETTETSAIAGEEFDESLSEESLPEDQEALRKQIELFVERTVEPEENFDYFDGLDKKAAKRNEESKASETDLVSTEKMPSKEEPLTVLDPPVPEFHEVEEDGTNTEPEAAVVSDPAVDLFFFGKTERTEPPYTKQADAHEAVNKLDDTDINLLLALGKKQALEESVGFVRVREAKNNFYDPTDEESLGNHVFAYDGEEFRDPVQISAIKTRYRKEKKTLWKRLLGTIFIALILLFTELLPMTELHVGFVSDLLANSAHRGLINLSLMLLAMLLSARPLLDGARGFFIMRPNRYSPLSIITGINLTYDVIGLLFARKSNLILYDFVIVVFLAVSIIGDAIRLNKETLTFDIISDPQEKFSLEKADPTPEISREEKILLKRDLLVEKVSFVGKYFNRTARRSTSYTEYFIELLATLIAASLVTIGFAAVSRDLSASANVFMLVLVICMPMQHLIGSYPFGRLSKLLYRHQSAIIGEAVDREYVGANTVYLDDIEVFGHHGVSISGLRTYNEANFYDVLYHALAAFSRVEGPLRYVFENSSHEIEMAEDVELLNIYPDGIEAMVDGTQKVLIGNADFMQNNGFTPKQNENDEQKVENGEICILYMAINGILSAKFYMKYTITKRFETFVSEMHENNTNVGIRTLDPNVSEKMLSLLRKDKETVLSVIRPTLNDLVPIGRRSDSSIITSKNSHMIARILSLCGRVKKINRTCAMLRVISMLVALLGVIPLVFIGQLSWLPALAVVVYQLLWLIPSTIYTAIKLK